MTPKQFLQAIKPACAWVSRKSTLPILECLRFRDGKVLATDISGQATYPIEGVEGLDCCVNAAAITRALGAMPADEKLTIKAEDKQIILRAGRSRHKLPTLPASDMPTIKAPDSDEGAFLIPKLGETFSRLQPFMGVKAVQYYMCGICLQGINGRLRAISMDGYRVAVQDMGSYEEDLSVIVPAFAVQRLAGATNPRMIIDQDAQTMHVFDGETVFSFKLIDGRYPDVDRVIPKPTSNPITIKAKDFSAALASAEVATDEANKFGVLIQMKGKSATVSCSNSAGINSESGFDFEHPDNLPETRVGMNVGYLKDVVSAMLAPSVEWFPHQTAGNLFRDPLDEGFLSVVMPMKI